MKFVNRYFTTQEHFLSSFNQALANPAIIFLLGLSKMHHWISHIRMYIKWVTSSHHEILDVMQRYKCYIDMNL